MKFYDNITNHFPNGIYPYVRMISLYDERPFEHEFFIRIQKSFLFLEKSTLTNYYAQNHKYSHESSILNYCYLTDLDFGRSHDD
ncbi:unnamed protein product [Adineta steineri]|uniref:Uncharacterized protein n=1 Tax=Adineta steineri TaxID=433720 RepID=A0A814S0H8_9BILA|nr:unnamed protein product [Adineta steineri]